MRRFSQTAATSAVILAALIVTGLISAAPASAAVPTPGPGEAVVTVRVGGDRVDDATVGALPGVTLGLYAGQADTVPAETCVSDADGECSFVVSGALIGTSPWVGEISAPAGWFTNDRLRTGPGSGSGSIDTPYRFQTPALVAGGTYRSTSDFMYSSSNSLNTRSNGVWQQSRANPPLPVQCGMDVALVLDLSASVGSNLPTLKSAADSFADAFVGTPSRMAVYSFSAQSPSVESGSAVVDENDPALRSVSTQAGADAFKATYAGWGLGAGTNWDAALQRVAESGVHYDAVIVLTDGNPTRWGGGALHGDGGNTHFTDVEAAVFSANTIKAQGTRVVSFGVGSGVSGITSLNLAAISGPVPFDAASGNVATADYFQIPDFSGAGDELRNLALSNCAGALTVVKQIVPSTTSGDDISGAVPAGAGWQFDATATTTQATVDPGSAATTDDGTGAVAFEVGYPPAATDATVAVTEVQQPGYTLVQQAGANAVCTDLTTGDPVAVGAGGALGFSVGVAADQAVSCAVYNRAPAPAATVQVDKAWVVDGTSYANGAQPAGLSAALAVSPPGGGAPVAQSFGSALAGYRVGDAVTLTETTALGSTGCSLVRSRVTEADGASVDGPVPYSAALAAPVSHYTITNVVTCPTAPITPPVPAEPAGAAGALADTGSGPGGGWGAAAAVLALLAGTALIGVRARRQVRRD